MKDALDHTGDEFVVRADDYGHGSYERALILPLQLVQTCSHSAHVRLAYNQPRGATAR
jgi:hypothetical protein